MNRITNIWHNLWYNKARLQQNIKKGTIYLRGEQSHFQAAVAKALKLKEKESRRLSFKITIDLLQSFKNKDLTYRVDYALERS